MDILQGVPFISTQTCQTIPGVLPYTVKTVYTWSNAETVQSAQFPCYGTTLPGQNVLAAPQSYPSFETVSPKSLSTAPGPMGTDYKS